MGATDLCLSASLISKDVHSEQLTCLPFLWRRDRLSDEKRWFSCMDKKAFRNFYVEKCGLDRLPNLHRAKDSKAQQIFIPSKAFCFVFVREKIRDSDTYKTTSGPPPRLFFQDDTCVRGCACRFISVRQMFFLFYTQSQRYDGFSLIFWSATSWDLSLSLSAQHCWINTERPDRWLE